MCRPPPPHPEASPDRPGAVTVSRIVARNSGHPEPYTGTRTVLVCSSRPRGSAAAAGGGTAPRNPPLRWRGAQGTRNDPDNFGSAAGGFTQALGGVGRLQTRTRRVSRGRGAARPQTRKRRISAGFDSRDNTANGPVLCPGALSAKWTLASSDIPLSQSQSALAPEYSTL